MGLPAKSPQAILWGPRKVGEQYSPRDVHFILTFEPDESHRKGVSNTPMLFACIRAFLS